MNLQKGNLYLIIAIIVGVVAIGATGFASWKYFGGGSELEKNGSKIIKPLIEKETEKSEVVDEKTNWKSYRNEKVGFEIKYPASWKTPYYKVGWSAGISLDAANYCIVDVSSSFINSNKDEIADLIKKRYNKTSLKIDSIDGVRLTKSQAGLTEAVYFSFNNSDFRIARNRGSGNKIEDECVNIFNQMLSTFKFTKQNSLNEIKTGKFKIDYEEVNKIQQSVNEGHQPWRLNPNSVVMTKGLIYGFTSDDFKTIKQISFYASAGTAEYEVIHNNKSYLITVIKPISGENKIWIISETKEK